VGQAIEVPPPAARRRGVTCNIQSKLTTLLPPPGESPAPSTNKHKYTSRILCSLCICSRVSFMVSLQAEASFDLVAGRRHQTG
jgi:hypothetical protein